jgi:V/A-type H+/Na+-transporting ATPase subunit I
MRFPESFAPVRMVRVAVVAPDGDPLRDVLALVADSGSVDLDGPLDGATDGAADVTVESGDRVPPGQVARLAPVAPADLDALAAAGRNDLVAGEVDLRRRAGAAVRRDGVAALAGWCSADAVEPLARRVAPVGGAVVPLPRPPGTSPPTLLRTGLPLRRSFAPLLRAYGTVPYADVDPTLLAGIAYVVMFGMMFADAGHGLVLLGLAALLRSGRPRRWPNLTRMWPFLAGAGVASAAFGALFGEFFGPTGVVPVRWLDPLEQPVQLLAAGVGLGAVLLGGAYVVGVVNRWREGTARLALYAPTGVAGAALFTGVGLLAAGFYTGGVALTVTGTAIAGTGLVLAAIGLYAASGGGTTGAVETSVHLFDLLIRLGANLASFARLAAFGLTHAALGGLVWGATAALWAGGGWRAALAVPVFVAGNALTFGLEAVVAAIQALRLEYYELFSRVFVDEGRPFRPWHLPVVTEEGAS